MIPSHDGPADSTATVPRPPAQSPGGSDDAPRSGDRLGLVLVVGGLIAAGLFGSWQLLLVIVAVVVMIFLHELGHYLTAKSADMKVTEFFLGFGPRIWSFRRGETEYGLKAIPAGAYVRIIGMNNLDEVDPADEPRTYRQAPYWRRMSVAVAGSAMHYLLALGCLFVLLVAVGLPDEDDWRVQGVVEDSAAEVAGLRDGDRLLAVDGQPVGTFDDLLDVVQPIAGRPVDLLVERDGEQLTLSTTIGERISEEAADGTDGLVYGDRLVSVDGQPATTWEQFSALVEVGGSYTVVVIDGSGQILEVRATIDELAPAATATYGFLGVGADESLQTLNPVGAAARSVDLFGEVTWQSVAALGRFFTPGGITDFMGGAFSATEDDDTAAGDSGRTSIEDENRIISIVGGVRIGAQATEAGIENFLWFFALLNIFVGTFNLVPLLPLDGGHVAVATYERIRSRRGQRYHADVSKLLPVTYAVVAVLVVIGLVAIYRDLVDPVNLPS